MARNAKRKLKSDIEDMARKAAEEAVEELESEIGYDSPEERDLSFSAEESESVQEFGAKNVWIDGPRLNKKGGPTTIRLYLDNKWIGTKRCPYPKGWDGIREEYPQGGYFKGVAVDGDNRYITTESIEIAPHPDWIKAQNREKFGPPEKSESNSLEILEVMKESQREAEVKAQVQQNGLASIMTALVQSQQQAAQNNLQMMQEANKQMQQFMMTMLQVSQQPKGPDPMMTLLTTLLTQKPRDEGMKPLELVKLVEDAKKNAKEEERRNYEFLEKKADALAELKAEAMSGEGGEEEGGIKGIIKGFLPVLTQLAANQQATTANQAQMMQSQQNPALQQGFIEEGPARPMIPAARPQQRRPVQQAQAPQSKPQTVSEPEKTVSVDQKAQDQAAISRFKDQVFSFCATDIGQAMLHGQPANRTAETCIIKLEKEGVPRQTVANVFKLEDFYGYADQFGLPAEAKPWLKDFYESIQALAANQKTAGSNGSGMAEEPPIKRAEPIPAKPVPATVAPPNKDVKSASAKTVQPRKRPGPGAPAREAAKNPAV